MKKFRIEIYRPQYMSVEVELPDERAHAKAAEEEALAIAEAAPEEDWSEPAELTVWAVEEDVI